MKEVNTLFQHAMKPIMNNRRFLTEEEYKTHQGEITVITGCVRNILEELKKL